MGMCFKNDIGLYQNQPDLQMSMAVLCLGLLAADEQDKEAGEKQEEKERERIEEREGGEKRGRRRKPEGGGDTRRPA